MTSIDITEVQIKRVEEINGLVAFASFVINGCIYLSGIAIHKKLSADGYRLTYPSKKAFSIFYPINRETSYLIEEKVLSALHCSE